MMSARFDSDVRRQGTNASTRDRRSPRRPPRRSRSRPRASARRSRGCRRARCARLSPDTSLPPIQWPRRSTSHSSLWGRGRVRPSAVTSGQRGSGASSLSIPADPLVSRVEADAPGALARTGHHVQVVHRMPGRSDTRPVVPARDQEHVAVAHGDRLVDLPVEGIGAVQAEAVAHPRCGSSRSPRARPRARCARRACAAGRTTSCRRACTPRPRSAGRRRRRRRRGSSTIWRVACPPPRDLDGDRIGRHVGRLEPPLRRCVRQRELTATVARDRDLGAERRVHESLTRSNTPSRPRRSHADDPISTRHEPERGSAAASIPSRETTRRSPGARRSTRSPANHHPASSGVISTGSLPLAAVPAGGTDQPPSRASEPDYRDRVRTVGSWRRPRSPSRRSSRRARRR